MFIDTHCHLDSPILAKNLADVLLRANRAGISDIVNPGTNPDSWARIHSLVQTWKQVHPAYGLHPMDSELFTEPLLECLSQFLNDAVAIGEIGLDYQLTEIPRDVQIAAFRAQLKLAVKKGLPVLIHCRKAFRDMLTVLKEEHVQQVGGVLHAFSGSPEIATECIKLGLYISVAGPVTWHQAVKASKVVASVPLEHLLLETDAPDLPPEPHRGDINEPGFLLEIAKRVAAINKMSLEELGRITTQNARKLFQLPRG